MRNVTWRAILIGLILIPINSYLLIQMESVYYVAHSTLFSLFFNVLLVVLVLIVLNIPLRKLSADLAFKQGELLTIYIMLCQASALAGHSMMQILPPTMAGAFGLATPENEWKELFWRYIPEWLAVSDERAVDGYIGKKLTGESTLYTAEHINAWLTPVMVWAAFICTVMFVMICFNVIIRKQWIDRERLTYPIVQLPFEITNRSSRLFRNKLMWLGFTIVGVMTFINGLNYFFPVVPSLRVRPYNLGEFFTGRPWNAMGYTPLTFRPFLIGLVFLIPLDISFSCWFFFFLWKVQQIFESTMGWRPRPLLSEQAAGAHISLFFIAIWIGRRHLSQVFKVALKPATREESDNDSTELLDYKIAVWGLICGIGLILFFCWKAGMSLWVAGGFFALYLMTEIGITRIRAEVGSPFHDLHFAGPEILMIGAVGTRKIGPRNLTIMSFFWFLSRMHYSDVMPHQLEGFKLADRARMNNRWVVGAMLLATVLGTFVAFWAILHSGYTHSNVVLQFFGREPFARLQQWLTFPTSTDMAGLGFFVYGVLFGIFLMFMRVRFLWWSLHPAGYAVSSTWSMRTFWSQFVVAWLVKWLILKYGGVKAYRKAVPFFFGIILGEFVVGGFWAILSIILKKPIYTFTAWW